MCAPSDAWDSAMDASARVDARRCTRAGARAGYWAGLGGTTARGRAEERGGGEPHGRCASANPEGGGTSPPPSRRGRRADWFGFTSRRGLWPRGARPAERGAGDGWRRRSWRGRRAWSLPRSAPRPTPGRSVDVDVPGYPAARSRRAALLLPRVGDAKVCARRTPARARDVDDVKQATRA